MLFTLVLCIRQLWVIFNRRQEIKVDVLYRSNNFIVLNKGHDILINSNDPTVSTALHAQLSEAYPYLCNPQLKHNFHFVHRLDYATSGVICVALNRKAASAAAISFQKRLVRKYYIALVRGHVSADILDITAPIGEVASEAARSHKMCVAREHDCVSVRTAWTRLLVLERGTYARYPATKVLLKPVTGRRHQLRVHCSHIGHTIVGDFTYSGKKDIAPHRTFLHSLRLILPNPLEPLDIHTPDPFPCANDATDSWRSIELVNDLLSGFEKLDKCMPTN